MKCGFFEIDITPTLGSIIPGGFAARYADEVLDKLYVRAAVIKNQKEALALAVIDACGITKDVTEKITDAVSKILNNLTKRTL